MLRAILSLSQAKKTAILRWVRLTSLYLASKHNISSLPRWLEDENMNWSRFSGSRGNRGTSGMHAKLYPNADAPLSGESSTTFRQRSRRRHESTFAEFSGLSKRLSSPIQHVVIIIQENRTTNDLFNGLPGADTVRTCVKQLGLTRGTAAGAAHRAVCNTSQHA